MRRVIVFGGYGVFGSRVAETLSRWGIPLTVAGRQLRRAEAFAHSLGRQCQARSADVASRDSCLAALEGHVVAVNCAGPFNRLGRTLLEACLDAGCHYADIADDRGYAAVVRSLGERFAKVGLAAVYGCSSLPGISGALALLARAGTRVPVERARVTLFIGNNNPKGQAAVGSFLADLGRPIAAPQGTLLGFQDREVVTLPPPFGRRAVFNFDAPEYDLFPALLGAKAVLVKLGFELRLATETFALLARLGHGYGQFAARLLELAGRPSSGFGCSGGAVMSELVFADGTVRWAALAARSNGQRMAALPCALVARTLQASNGQRVGAATAYEFLGAQALVEQMIEAGFEMHDSL